MVVKTLTITESAYEKIKRLKHGDESFSELFTRLAEQKMNVAEKFFGVAKLSPAEVEEWRKQTVAIRGEISHSLSKRQEKFRIRMKELNG